jgi:hypothetical protein
VTSCSPHPHPKDEAEELRRAIVAGVATVAEAAAWADRVIAGEAHPHPAVIAVGLAAARPPAEMVSLLGGVPGEADPTWVMRRLLGRMLRALDAAPARGAGLAREIDRMARDGDLPEEPFGSEAFLLDDAFELARAGISGSEAEALGRLRRYLTDHAA